LINAVVVDLSPVRLINMDFTVDADFHFG